MNNLQLVLQPIPNTGGYVPCPTQAWATSEKNHQIHSPQCQTTPFTLQLTDEHRMHGNESDEQESQRKFHFRFLWFESKRLNWNEFTELLSKRVYHLFCDLNDRFELLKYDFDAR